MIRKSVGNAVDRTNDAVSRVRFLCRDMMKLRLQRSYDVVLLLSTSKWLHLQCLS